MSTVTVSVGMTMARAGGAVYGRRIEHLFEQRLSKQRLSKQWFSKSVAVLEHVREDGRLPSSRVGVLATGAACRRGRAQRVDRGG